MVTSDEVDGDVGATPVGAGVHLVEEVTGSVIDGRGAEFGAQAHLFGAACYRDDVGSRRDAELDHGGADRARPSDDKQGLSCGQLRASVQRQVAHVERQCERRGADVVQARRSVEGAGDRCDGELGQAAKGLLRHGDDAAAHPFSCAFARFVDDTADVHAEREGYLAHDARHGAAAPGDVTEVERCGGHRYPHLARTYLGNRNV